MQGELAPTATTSGLMSFQEFLNSKRFVFLTGYHYNSQILIIVYTYPESSDCEVRLLIHLLQKNA